MDTVVLKEVGASYFDASACHLNLTAWATDPVWSKLSPRVRADLLDSDRSFLNDQLTGHPCGLIIVNGRQVLQEFERTFVGLEEVGAIERGAGGRYVLKGGSLGSSMVVGWTMNVPHHGSSAASRRELSHFLATADWQPN